MTQLRKYALCLEYDGTNFKGWQQQKTPPIRSIEEVFNSAIARIANHPINVVAAGRTDAGVHATNQILHFETSAKRNDYSWIMGVNSHLPDDCNAKWIQEVSLDFHARFDAISRVYRYYIYANRCRSALNRLYQTWVKHDLNVDFMQQAANYLLGEHDFSAFRSSECQSKSTHRNIHYLTLKRLENDTILVEIKANAFLHHMVRNIVGTLLDVGKGKEIPEYMYHVLQSKDRTKAGITAPPQGLFLHQVNYPEGIFNV